MRSQRVDFNGPERAAYRAVIAFLDGRLEDRATIDWALGLRENARVKRLALLDLIDHAATRPIAEPWRSAWRLIEESWSSQEVEGHTSTAAYVARRIRSGERSGSLIAAIVRLVAPRLEVKSLSDRYKHFKRTPRRPKQVGDLFWATLTSGDPVDPARLELPTLTDRSFLTSLTQSLDAAVMAGLDVARRMGRDGKEQSWSLGQLLRVYHVSPRDLDARGEEPDRFHRGIAPSVKLLHAAVSRLGDLDISLAKELHHRWRLVGSPVHLRLWAALARNPQLASPAEVSAFLVSLDDRQFWRCRDYPEIAELRAVRFADLDPAQQAPLTARIRLRPSRKLWPKRAAADCVEGYRLYWTIRELRRIEAAGATLPQDAKLWLDARIDKFPDLAEMSGVHDDFPSGPTITWVPARPDSRYDLQSGEDRLKALESVLVSRRQGREDSATEGARDWMSQAGNQTRVLADLESADRGGADFPAVWNWFGWSHSPPAGKADSATQDGSDEAGRVVTLLGTLPKATVRQAIEGISRWLSVWERQLVAVPAARVVWLKLWPAAAEATNAQQPHDEEIRLNVVAPAPDDQELELDLDTLNTPAGKLVGVFLAACRSVPRPFDADPELRAMRDAVEAATGRSGLIARHRMVEALPYLLGVDPEWTRGHLVQPLIGEGAEALVFWRAIARQTHFREVLEIIGASMTERAVDRRLGRATRQSLVFSLVVECLYALKEDRAPAVRYPRIQQMIRSLDDEVRSYAAEAVPRFLRDLSKRADGSGPSLPPETLFRDAARPFLRDVWPQEQSLTTLGVSRALAGLPAASVGAFAEAVAVIEPFLVPFECWSMLDYGFHGGEEGPSTLTIIDSRQKATAFLTLLDRTIGAAEGSVVPYDLPDALEQIRKVAADLAGTPVFRRLATTARRP